MHHNHVMIWGSGKIGRGFAADIFASANAKLTFVDAVPSLIDSLNQRGSFTILRLPDAENGDSIKISNYSAYTSDDPAIFELFKEIDALVLAIFPKDFYASAASIAKGVALRLNKGVTEPINVYLCTNTPHSKDLFRAEYVKAIGDLDLDCSVGSAVRLAECIVIRMAVQPTAEQMNDDPLVVVTNGYPELIVDKSELGDDLPDTPALVFTDRIEQDEVKKLYTYNMLHALYAYLGVPHGYSTVFECTRDKAIQSIATGALDEVAQALRAAFGYTKEELDVWNAAVLKNMKNPILNDALARVGGDPVRKLKNNDRLTGAALLCIKNGIYPYFISKAIAGAFCFAPEGDPTAKSVQKLLKEKGIRAACTELCSLELEPSLVQMIAEAYSEFLDGIILNYDPIQIAFYKKVYTGGFFSEKTYRACCQALLLNFYDILGIEDDELFQVTTGFSGGMAITGDGVCGGYSGGMLIMGKYSGRRLEQTKIDGDKQRQYTSYKMSQELHDLLVETFGSVVCSGIHNSIFAKSYCLRTKPVRNEFEEAGAHTYKCTTVIAMASLFTARLLIKHGYIDAAALMENK